MNFELAAIKNLILLQHFFGAGSLKAFRIYKTLSEKGTLNNDISKIDFLEAKDISRIKNSDKRFADKVISDCQKNSITILPIISSRYPERLRNIEVPPLVLYIKGNFPDIDNEPIFCIVGPRKVSEFGIKAAYSLSSRLSKAGMIIVSGAAIGCDSFSHLGAIKSGGRTIGVLACGICSDYLPQNRLLRQKISENCCLISEHPPYQPVGRFAFPIRNRLLSGLSLGVAIIEAGEKSGALITAKHANEQGRDVFVIPGNPTLPQYKGSNDLLRDGAHPLIDASDIFNAYLSEFADKLDLEKAFKKSTSETTVSKIQKKSTETLSNEAKIVYNYLDKQVFTADDILGAGIDDNSILSALTELEIEHFIKASPGGIYTMI